MTIVYRLFVGCAALALVAACSTPESRYADSHDSTPLQVVTAAQVRDAEPRPDPILAAGNKSPYTVNGETYEVLEHFQGYQETGVASWYGAKFDGFETSNGEIFDVYKASAAHRSLPIPCFARVTNLANGRSVVVRVNDRGPFHSERLIDLSYAAAIKLGFADQGTARVEVSVIEVAGVDDRRNVPLGHYRYLQIGAFGQESSALRLRGELQAFLTEPVFVAPVQSGKSMLYRVRIGPVDNSERLRTVQEQLRASGYDEGQLLP